ncbi:hypothetical protein [Alkaliphilus hydrothermalis]|uniref:Peptidase C39-like domain-containing protein n=1 Tax=Alkaliphilus hydrothermalis TaxID=1482730 RepID=A0ABS2NN69_9FIRM|nr:hypothetical protein [Alkaliphilus hydrothermalis]MBM7614392.1 hypothetical protein [Alkaliphilus hydrothermalis]
MKRINVKIAVFVMLIVGLTLYTAYSMLAEEEISLEEVRVLAADGMITPITKEDVTGEGSEKIGKELLEDTLEEQVENEIDKEGGQNEKKATEEVNQSDDLEKEERKQEELRKAELLKEEERKRAVLRAEEAKREETKKQEENKQIEANPNALQVDLNSYVLNVMKTYPRNGSHPYLLNNDYQNYNGVTANINYQNKLLLKAHPSGSRASHCSGLTFEVFFKAMQQRNKEAGISPEDFNGMSYDQLYNFAMTWYVANGNKQSSNIAIAVEKYGIGHRVSNLEDAKPGDFLDFSRENNTGHTVVFLNWIRDNGKIIGLRYWSTQGSTNGINYNEEYFNVEKSNGTKYGDLIIDQIYIARVTSINKYR